MKYEIIKQENIEIASVESLEPVLLDVQSALDFIMTVQYETGCNRILLNKGAVAEDFFILSTGLAGEILQKFINYQVKLALWGDFSGYTSKPLRDFMYESNCGRDLFFVTQASEGLELLARA